MISSTRIRLCNDEAPRASGRFVLYWMIANRRTRWNFSLDRAVEWCRELGRPLFVLEPLDCTYRWASDRLHRFVVQGMIDNFSRFEKAGVAYYPYVEPSPGAGSGLLEKLAGSACVVVTDDYPAFRLPGLIDSAAKKMPVRFEAVDSNGLLPMRSADRVFPTAFAFRRFLQKTLPAHLGDLPKRNPLDRLRILPLKQLPPGLAKWPRADLPELEAENALARLPIDHSVGPAAVRGGEMAAVRVLRRFVRDRLEHYAAERNEPEKDGTSGLSPYLHFGHVSSHQVFTEIMKREGWGPPDLDAAATGKRSGWWGVSESAEGFLDQLVTWRELGFNFCWQRDDYDDYDSLPDWARKTLAEHLRDPRPHVYSATELEQARTHDPLWNAAQTQLVSEGRMHNYLRMLWGKKILEWSGTPRKALDVMIELNNKYGVDGRDPNSYSGIFWVLGRYDRAWGPERPIFGKIRYMSSANTARKLRVRDYIDRHTPPGSDTES